MRVKIIKNGINGEGIAYINKKPVFVPDCLKNEIVDIDIVKQMERYSVGKINYVVKTSGNRVDSPCQYSDKCGSCTLIHANYETQLRIKYENLRETLQKYCGYIGPIEEIVRSDKDLFYRNKCNLPFVDHEGKIANGLYQSGSNIPVSIDKCVLHATKMEKIRVAVLAVLNKYNASLYNQKSRTGYRQLIIRGFKDSYQVVIITGNDDIDSRIVDEISKIENVSSFYHGINTMKSPISMMPDKIELLFGSRSIPFSLGEYQLQLQPKAFFQLNQFTAEKLYKRLDSLIKNKVNLIVEAYCGIGAISMYLHKKGEKIIGIDIEKSAIEDGKYNAKLNNIDNVNFRLGDASSQLTSIMAKETIDVLVVDPPRKGIDDKLLDAIKNNKIKKILYVSCNPATLAKNLNVLKDTYSIKRVIPFDMFPQTALVETIVELELKD